VALNSNSLQKTRNGEKIFWNDLVGPTLGSDISVETWIRGPIAPIKFPDGTHQVVDVKFIDWNGWGIPWTWSETNDHAKWGISKENNWICVGDLNRMVSQEKRGGGTIAFQHSVLWGALSKVDSVVPPTGSTAKQALKIIVATHSK